MLTKGIRLFKVLGITISIDYTWFIVFFLISWSLSYGYYPAEVPGLTTGLYVAMGLISSVMLFVCVLLHELSHSYTSNRLGLEVKEITLFIFGGVAHLTKDPDDPVKELKIAIAGPAASAVLAGLFFLLRTLSVQMELAQPLTTVFSFLMTINIVLLVFNLIPGLPLDGGRVLKALWWLKSGSIDRATRAASEVGRGFALFLILLGFLQMAAGNFIGGLWSILIGVFLRQAAGGSYKQMVIQKRLETIRVEEIMTKDVATIPPELTLEEAIEKYFFTHHFVSFPVTEDGTPSGALLGLLSLNDIRAMGRERWGSMTVAEAMDVATPELVLSPEDTALEALVRMNKQGRGRYPVARDAKLLGIISRRDIMKTLELKLELQERQ